MQRTDADGRRDGRCGSPHENLSYLLGASRNLPPRTSGVSVSLGSVAAPVECVVYLSAAMHSRGKRGRRPRRYLGQCITKNTKSLEANKQMLTAKAQTNRRASQSSYSTGRVIVMPIGMPEISSVQARARSVGCGARGFITPACALLF